MGAIETAIRIENQDATIGMLRAHRDALRAQRDELLAALEGMVKAGAHCNSRALAAAFAAIAKAKGV